MANGIVDVQRAEVVRGQRRAPADYIADGFDKLAQLPESHLRGHAALVDCAGTIRH